MAGEGNDTVALYRKLVTRERYDTTSIPGREIDEEAASDRSRVLYSSAFRRLQQRTQVFALAENAAVRSRLTHSLEVADVGGLIAAKIVDALLSRGGLEPKYCKAFVHLAETGCLAHDIGNPPFGHFGEKAIQEWFRKSWPDVCKEAIGASAASEDDLQLLVKDFLEFDGNPQGIRILTRLQGRTTEERRDHGMNLTRSQVLTALKYPRAPSEDGSGSAWKKPGFFESERDRIETAWSSFGDLAGAGRRFPIAYIVEAADDISYCLGDMEDGIEQRLLTPLALQR